MGITLYLVLDYLDNFKALTIDYEVAKEIYSEFGDSIQEIHFGKGD